MATASVPVSVYLKTLERDLAREIQAWRDLRQAGGASLSRHHQHEAELTAVRERHKAELAALRERLVDARRQSARLYETDVLSRRVGVAKSLSEMMCTVIFERAASRVYWQRKDAAHAIDLEEAKANACFLPQTMGGKITDTLNTCATKFEHRVEQRLSSYNNRIATLRRRVKHAQDLHRASVTACVGRALQSEKNLFALASSISPRHGGPGTSPKSRRRRRQKRQSMEATSMSLPMTNAVAFTAKSAPMQRTRRHSMPLPVANEPLVITKASRGKVVWVPEVQCWGIIGWFGELPENVRNKAGAKGAGHWVGVALSLPLGSHDGHGLFPARSNKHGLFCRVENLTEHPKNGNPRERRRRSAESLKSSISMRRTLAKIYKASSSHDR